MKFLTLVAILTVLEAQASCQPCVDGSLCCTQSCVKQCLGDQIQNYSKSDDSAIISNAYAEPEVCHGVFKGHEIHFSVTKDRAHSYQIGGTLFGYENMNRDQATIYTFDGWGNGYMGIRPHEFEVTVYDSHLTNIGNGKIEFWERTVSACPSVRADCYPQERRIRKPVPGKKAQLTFGDNRILFDCPVKTTIPTERVQVGRDGWCWDGKC